MYCDRLTCFFVAAVLFTAGCGAVTYSDGDRFLWCRQFKVGLELLAEVEATGGTASALSLEYDVFLLEFSEMKTPPEIVEEMEMATSPPPDIFEYANDAAGFAEDSDRYYAAEERLSTYLIDTCGIEPDTVRVPVG